MAPAESNCSFLGFFLKDTHSYNDIVPSLRLCANAASPLEQKKTKDEKYHHLPSQDQEVLDEKKPELFSIFRMEKKKNQFCAFVKHAIDSLNEGIMSASVRAKFPDYERALEQQHTRL